MNSKIVLLTLVVIVIQMSVVSAITDAEKTTVEMALVKTLSNNTNILYASANFGPDDSLDITLVPMSSSQLSIALSILTTLVAYAGTLLMYPDIGRLDLTMAKENRTTVCTMYCLPEWAKSMRLSLDGGFDSGDLVKLVEQVVKTMSVP